MAIRNILLIEPKVRKQHPNVGLLKIGGYHQRRGDRVIYLRDSARDCPFDPDVVYVSAIFTYYADKTTRIVNDVRRRFPRAEIRVGGVYPSLLPDHVIFYYFADLLNSAGLGEGGSDAGLFDAGGVEEAVDALVEVALFAEFQRAVNARKRWTEGALIG